MSGVAAVVLRATGGGSTAEWTLRDPEDEVVIGRGSGATWRMDEPLISRQHVRLVWRGQGLEVTDLGSRNGSRVNGTPIRTPTILAHGDRLEVGPVVVAVTLLCRDRAVTVGCPAPAERTQATRVAPRSRARPLWIAGASVLAAVSISAGVALRPGEPASETVPAPAPAPAPDPARPAADQPAAASVADDPSVPTGALRRRAIEAYAASRRREALRLFRRLRARLPQDQTTAVVLARMEP